MYLNYSDVVARVNSPDEAEKLVSQLLVKFGSNVTIDRLNEEASSQHRTTEDVARQTVNNLFRSLKTRRDFRVW